jgi:hypothetical protein
VGQLVQPEARDRHKIKLKMISREKLERWTNSDTADQEEARDTQRAIRSELNEGSLNGVSQGLDFTTYLQGSYRNTTMVYDSGDVDILVIRTDNYHADLSEVSNITTDIASARNPRQMFEEINEGVYRTLQAQYGARNVQRGEKAIEVESDTLPLGADVVPCLQYRRFWQRQPGNHMKGIVFWTDNGAKIVNFPRRHRILGEQYNSWCDGKYKSTIRIFKNFRNYLVERQIIDKESIPSYFIECLISNVDTSTIAERDIRDRVEGVLFQLELDAEDGFQGYTAQHGMEELFGNKTTQWNTNHAKEFIRSMLDYYNRE